MFDKAVDKYFHALKFVSDFYKTQNTCDKAFITYHSTIQFVCNCYKAQKMCDKAVKTCYFAFVFTSDWYKFQFFDSLLLRIIYNSMWDEAVDVF